MDQQDAILAGATIGLTIAAPIGPMAALCIRRTLTAGYRAGLSTGAGASTLHLTYAAIALAGVDHVAQWLKTNHALFDLASALILFCFAFRCWRPRSRRIDVIAPAQAFRSLTHDYATAIAFGSINPMSVVLLVGATAAVIGAHQPAPADVIILLCGVFLGSFGWWCILTGIIAAIGARLHPRMIRGLDIAASASMGALAIVALRRLVYS